MNAAARARETVSRGRSYGGVRPGRRYGARLMQSVMHGLKRYGLKWCGRERRRQVGVVAVSVAALLVVVGPLGTPGAGAKPVATTTTTTTTTTTAASVLTATGSQNPNLTVKETVSPTSATTGTTVSWSATVKNNTNSTKAFVFKFTLTDPSGGQQGYTSLIAFIGARSTTSNSASYQVASTAQRGNYTVTSAVTQQSCSSACTSTASVVLPVS